MIENPFKTGDKVKQSERGKQRNSVTKFPDGIGYIFSLPKNKNQVRVKWPGYKSILLRPYTDFIFNRSHPAIDRFNKAVEETEEVK